MKKSSLALSLGATGLCLAAFTPALPASAAEAAPPAPAVSDVQFNADGTRAYVDVDAEPGNVITVKNDQGSVISLKMTGAKGHLQVPVPVAKDAEVPVTVQQSNGQQASVETNLLVAPAPALETVWSGKTGAVLRIDKEYGIVKIYDADGKFVAQRGGQSQTPTLVNVPLTGETTTFTAVRSSGLATSHPTAFSVRADSDTLAEPTLVPVAGFTGAFRVTGQPGASFTLETRGASLPVRSGLFGDGGTAALKDLPAGTYSLTQSVRGDVSATVEVVIPAS